MSNSFSIVFFKKKVFLGLGFLFIFCINSFCQDQKKADTLEAIYRSGNYSEQNQLKILRGLAINHINPQKKLAYSEKLIRLAQELDSSNYLWTGFTQKGDALRNKGDYIKALESHFQAERIAQDEKSDLKLGESYITIADVYSDMDDHNNAEIYYNRAIELLRKSDNPISLATSLLNAGDELSKNGKYDVALQYFEESGRIFKDNNYLIGTAYTLGNVGMVYAEQGKDDLAEMNINEAIKTLEKMQAYSPISEYLSYMADIYSRKNNMNRAFTYAQRSLDLAKIYKLKKEISDANLKLSELYEKTGDQATSDKYYIDHIDYRDSVKNLESVKQIADMRADFEIQKKEDEILVLKKEKIITDLKANEQKIIKYIALVIAGLILLLAISYFRRYRLSKKTSLIIEAEKNRSQKLLLNILPKKTATELIHKGKVQAKKFQSVSVMFTDFKNFTKYSENLSPETLVETIGFYFSKFDEIIKKYGLEKIKTIGDAYMCAGGLPFPTEDHAQNMIRAAFEIIEFVEKTKNNKEVEKMFDIRIGINTGPVVAGVVGSTKFAYDIWGDTVNVASRMESNSELGKINISENTYALVKDSFDCEYRGKVKVKNKGMMKMYFVNGIKDNAADNVPDIDKIQV
jgi:class 3 adenylate cyclase/Tfp pilus assembly protein PilF